MSLDRPDVIIVYHVFAHYRRAVIEMLARRLDERGAALCLVADFSVSSSSGIPCIGADELRRISVQVESVRNIWRSNILWQKGLLKALWRKDGLVVLLGDAKYASTWVSAIFLRILGRRVAFWTHGTLKPLTGVRGLVLRVFYSLPSMLLLYSERSARLIHAAGVRTQMRVVGNSQHSRAQLADFNEDCGYQFDLFFSGRLTRAKRVDLVLQAIGLLEGDWRPVRFCIIGDGPEMNALQQQALAVCPRSDITFLGAIYDEEEVARLMMSSRCFVIPSGAGLSVIHAMGLGLPVITGDDPQLQKPEAEAIVPGVTGDFFSEGDVVDLADKISAWVEIGGQVHVRDACRLRVLNEFSAEAQADKILAALEVM